MKGFVLALLGAVVAASSFAIPACSSSGGGHNGCVPQQTQSCTCSDGTSGTQVCQSTGTSYSECTCGGSSSSTSSSTSSSSGGTSSSTSSGGSSSGGCIDTASSAACTQNSQCCQSGSDQPNGAICAGVAPNYTCHAACTSNSACTSNCCAALSSSGGSICSAASFCSSSSSGSSSSGGCAAIGTSCTSTAGCCQTGTGVGQYGAECASFNGSPDSCGSICYHNSQCSSNCCAQLTGLAYGACDSTSTGVTCIP